jgi:methionine synthase I (cobalamin-dependent)
MNPLIRELIGKAPVVTDGAWGTRLQAQGLPPGACPDEWNLSHPDRVEAVARSYVEAGSRIILTNTFGANRLCLDKYDLAGKAGEINRAGAEISKRAAGSHAKVFASIGPTGIILMMGEISAEEVLRVFEEQAQAAAQGGADGFVIETMADLAEARLALQAVHATGLPAVACMSFGAGPEKGHTMMGVEAGQAARDLTECGADVVGANCGVGISEMKSVCRRMRASTALPVWIKANAGLPRLEHGETVYDTTPEDFAGDIPALVEAGAGFVGGCCGTDPEFISSTVAVLQKGREVAGK